MTDDAARLVAVVIGVLLGGAALEHAAVRTGVLLLAVGIAGVVAFYALRQRISTPHP